MIAEAADVATMPWVPHLHLIYLSAKMHTGAVERLDH